MSTRLRSLSRVKRVVIKIGSALLVDRGSGIRKQWLDAICDDIAALKARGTDVLVVSSGAIALGRTVLDMPSGALKLEESQACAAVGQIALARHWSESLSRHQIVAGQILLTLGDTEERRRYLNARATLSQLLKIGAIPIINENDTVATTEIRYGDNDRLAARVATMAGADLLVLLSDIDGLYTAPPHLDPEAQFLDTIEEITPAIEAMAGGAASELSRGGMRTKIDAGKIATSAGCAMIIASGKTMNPLSSIENGARHSWFAASKSPVTARKTWIAGQLQPAGTLQVDNGAEGALRSGKSLLPAGVRSVSGAFHRGDTVSIVTIEGREIARGLAGYDADEARRICGRKSNEIENILGYAGRAAMIHRDDLVMTELGQREAAAGDRKDAAHA
ncbi:MAG: glutamate 5-kinase [Alphaproteobacteria bacterium]|jgi:glutamate 5-kinase|uniref:glutamate 5-kinase n=1 Tax=Rhizobium/Agrobacterium group TaxID=227290 RepID=UPI0006B92707|nr:MULTISPECIES: glutamate 5-kinase [Rhizobium/Agrobacterium group]MBU0739115.1 glutamate 5-kinase [Alphaproteobacteria bacterium]MDM7980513.1 glutamate 5-kinase [Rhizobium sp.]AOG09035.1 glutamate 5-kinase [Agrobacterium sp. RAC06]KPF57058.1 glutamate 5-kinase [Rhizobium sp. AAP116]MBU0832816.1 glutamate 5-kinase [Alphaproteobacteria bacterium]